MIWVFAREHWCWRCPTTCSTHLGPCSSGLPGGSCSGLQPPWALFSSGHLPVILGCASAIDPVLVRSAHHTHWKEEIKCHHLNCHRFLPSFTLEGTAFVHFWVYTKLVSESMSMRVDTVYIKGAIFGSSSTPSTATYAPSLPGPLPQEIAWSSRRQTRHSM